jgi:stage II sporulation protein D
MHRIAAAFLALALAACASAPKPAPAPAPAPGTPAQQPVASTQSSNRLTPLASIEKSIAEPRIRVGLLSDQAKVAFPRVNGGYYVISDAGPSMIRRGFTITAPLADAKVRYAVQVSAISDAPSATAFADKVRTETSQKVTAVFDPAIGQHRILVGDFPDDQTPVPLRADLIARGYAKEMSIVRRPSEEAFTKQHVLVDDEGDRHTISGEAVLVMPVSAETVTIDDKPYRTAARVFINARGLLNVVNELNLEDYLYGVVPAEMGPRIYDEIEGLKAQAVAARTYAVRNLGQFRSEGYDICPGPACQAYKGFSGEEPLTNQAVKETSGLVATYEGKMIDALYTSTCGGETSDVSTMFPGRNEPYLRRAKCTELELVALAGRADSGLLTEQQVNGRLFSALTDAAEGGANWSAADVERAVHAALAFGGAAQTTVARPPSSRRGDVLRYLASVMRLDEHARVLTMPEDRGYFFPQTQNRDDVAHLAAAFLIKYGLIPAQHLDRVDMNAAVPREELYSLLGSWLREHSVVQEAAGKILSIDGRAVTLKAEGKTQKITLPANIPLFRRLGDRLQEYREMPIMIGDRAFVQRNAKGEAVSMIVQANFDGASYDRTSSFANWTRSYRADELVTSINRRSPIQELRDIRPVTIDAAQRIAELEVTAEGGRKFILKGLPVRWSLNVPDNLFTYEKTKDADGVDRYTFFGKGWGHGIGMCQVGAYGMAFRGKTFEQILHNYYTGIEIVPMAQASR